MLLPKGATIAVADGEKLSLFRNVGNEASPSLEALPGVNAESDNKGSGSRPGHNQVEEDNFAAGTAAALNRQVLDGTISSLVIVAAPKTLGELRKHYHKTLSAVLVGEISKDMTSHSISDIAKAIAAA